MKKETFIAIVAIMAGDLIADTFVMSVSGVVQRVTVEDVPDFPSDITPGETFTATFFYDLESWEWYNFGRSYLMSPKINNSTNEGMTLTLEVGANNWSIAGPEFTNTSTFLEVADYRNGSFGVDRDSLKTDLGISGTAPSGFPFFLGEFEIDLNITDRDEYDFVTTHAPASNSNVIFENAEFESMMIQSYRSSGSGEWVIDLEVRSLDFSIITPPINPTISITRDSGNVVIEFDGILQSKDDLGASTEWTDIDPQPTSPLELTSPSGRKFYRARQ